MIESAAPHFRDHPFRHNSMQLFDGDAEPRSPRLRAVVVGLSCGLLPAVALSLVPAMDGPWALVRPDPAGLAATWLASAAVCVWLVHRQQATDRASRARERQLTGLMDAATESMWLVAPDHRVLAVNAIALERVGLAAGDALGRDWRTLIDRGVAAARARQFERVLAAGEAVSFEDERAGAIYEHHFTPVRDERGRVTAVAAFSRDITTARAAVDELRELSQRLTYHVSNSPLAVIEWGPDMRLTRWSAEAERVFGWQADEVLGKRMTDFPWIYQDDRVHVASVSRDLETGANPRGFSLNRNYRKDGSVVWCEWYNSSLVDDAGQVRSILSLVLDVTERRQLETTLRETATALAEANHLKDEFLATLSHELRTPLQAIVGWSHILTRATPTPERLQVGLDTIARNAQLQSQLIDDVLDVSRIVSGTLKLSLDRVDLVATLSAAVDTVRPAADAKQIRLQTRLRAARLTADGARLQQVAWNLLSNAVKFTPPGGEVAIEAADSGDAVTIVVRDTGVGIDPAFLPRVFDRFSQADGSSTRRHGGLGLGLAIVRHLVEMHGGTIEVASEGVNRGTVFTIRLPMRSPRDANPVGDGDALRRATHLPRSVPGVRTLVVDDDHDSREITAEILVGAGACVYPAPSVAAAVEIFSREPIDLIISDIGMPGEDGYALLGRLRALTGGVLPPAIAVTGYGYAADRQRALASGFDVHLTKPVIPDLLLQHVANLTAHVPGSATVRLSSHSRP